MTMSNQLQIQIDKASETMDGGFSDYSQFTIK